MTKTEFSYFILYMDIFYREVVRTYSSRECWANLNYKGVAVRIETTDTLKGAVNKLHSNLTNEAH